MTPIRVLATVFLIALLPGELYSLYCYKCLALDCGSEDGEACRATRDYIVRHLRTYYYIDHYLRDCPEPDEDIKWVALQYAANPCQEMNRGEVTCSLGRMKVVTMLTKPVYEPTYFVSHATIMGCATRDLLLKIKHTDINQCNDFHINGTSTPYRVFLEIEHCPQIQDWCVQDFCVTQAESTVKPFRDASKKGSKFEYGYTSILVIFGFVLIVILAIMGATLCRTPLNRASNYRPTENGVTLDDPILEGHRRKRSTSESENPSLKTEATEIEVFDRKTPEQLG